jgi:hypothetical protein
MTTSSLRHNSKHLRLRIQITLIKPSSPRTLTQRASRKSSKKSTLPYSVQKPSPHGGPPLLMITGTKKSRKKKTKKTITWIATSSSKRTSLTKRRKKTSKMKMIRRPPLSRRMRI